MLDMIKKGKFIEHAHVHNRIYGTSVTAVTDVTKRRQLWYIAHIQYARL